MTIPGGSSLTDDQHELLMRIVATNLDLQIRSVTATAGQFNDVLIVNDELVFRVPRTSDAAATLLREVAALRRLRGCLPISIPEPLDMQSVSRDGFATHVMVYRRLTGEPPTREIVDQLFATDSEAAVGVARQVGAFLRTLHAIGRDDSAFDLPVDDGPAAWRGLLDDFRTELFSYMRRDACVAVETTFQEFLDDPASFAWQPVLRHGDFGGSNLLYDAETRRLSGVIDFSGVALGDPAVDLASISAFHASLAEAMRPAYPELFAPDRQRRADFYRSTFALQQALWALRAGDKDEFDDGIAAYV